MDDVKSVLERTKKKVRNQYFRIRKDKFSDTYVIDQYFGLVKPNEKMGQDGWFRHSYLEKYITEDYPSFNIEDFSSENGMTIIKKKKEEDPLKAELIEYSNYFSMNNKLFVSIKSIKTFLNMFNIDFRKFTSLTNLSEYIVKFLNSQSISQLDKANYIFKFNMMLNDLYIQIEALKIENGRTFVNEKFRHLFLLVTDEVK